MAAVDDFADDLTRRDTRLLRVEGAMRNRADSMLRAAERRIQIRLRTQDLTAFGRARLESLLLSIKRTVAGVMVRTAGELDRALADLAAAEHRFIRLQLGQVIGIDLAAVSAPLSATQLAAIASEALILGSPAGDWWSRQEETMRRTVEGLVRRGVILGETTPEIVRAVDAATPLNRRQVDSLVRTAVQTVLNQTRIDTYRNSGVTKGIQWVSTLDSRTTFICISLDGKRWDSAFRPVGHTKSFPGPTAHWACRSTQIPWLKSSAELRGEGIDVPPGRRASLDGNARPASSLDDYESWLARQDEAFQLEALGKSRLDLWRSGKIGLTDLTDGRSRPLTVAALEAGAA